MSNTAGPSSFASATASLPAVAEPFVQLYRAFWTLESIPASTLELCRLRQAQLHGSEVAWQHREVELPSLQREELRHWPQSNHFSDAERACLSLAEVHAMDAQAISDAQANAVKAHYGEVGLVALVQALGVFDTIVRLGLIWAVSSGEVA